MDTGVDLEYDSLRGVLYDSYVTGVARYDSSFTYYFAEGYTGLGFEEWLCFLNPNGAPTTAHVTYMFADGTTQAQEVGIGATSRATVDVNQVVGPDRNVSVRITSDAPIAVERPM